MFKKIIFPLLLLSFSCQPILGQDFYRSSQLKEIADMLEESQNNVKVECDSLNGIITHIGLSIPMPEMSYPYADFMSFVKRYGLYCSLLNRKEREIRMNSDKVELDVRALCALDSIRDYSVSLDNNKISLTLNKVKISFPNDWQLISGMNKIECEKDFYRSLVDCEGLPGSLNIVEEIVQVEPISQNDYFKESGGCYLIKELNQDKYYVKLANDSIRPIFSFNYASESISNLMQNLVRGNYTIKCDQKLYGFKHREFEIPLTRFVDYCASQHCEPFIGIENEDESSIQVVVVYRNMFFQYNHLLYLDVEKRILETPQGKLKGTLYCYIPTQNLKNLFKDGK